MYGILISKFFDLLYLLTWHLESENGQITTDADVNNENSFNPIKVSELAV